ncbi:MAG: sigma-70 family RNA polymerase sigma factor [Nitriliruptorales bacterium]|nr:sigma-70 family RNA polymerase sigma factor [Nitriliruptorales bacterium]
MTTELMTSHSDAARSELFEHASERGYVLVSELVALADPLAHGDADVSDLVEEFEDADVTVVDDRPVEDTEDTPLPTGLSSDPVRQYLNEAAQDELLDAQQEQDLAKRYAAGVDARDLLGTNQEFSAEQRARLRRIVAEGDRSKDRLIRSNLRLVVPTAKRYAGNDLPMIEAIQEGNLGLIRAVEKFDHRKGYKFSTYAVWWIRQAIQRGLAKRGRTIRVPSTIWEQSGKVRRAKSTLRTRLGREPNLEEVAAEAGLKPERVEEIDQALRPTTSLDLPVGEDGDISLGDLLPDTDGVDPELDTAASDVRHRLVDALATLPERERAIIELRFGLVDGETKTLEEVGNEVDLTRERVRQLEKSALAKLKNPAAAHGLDQVWDALAA